jgi:GTP-binding protein
MNLKTLIDAIQQELADLPPITVFDAEAPTWDPETEAATPDATTIRRDDSGAFVCEGKWLEKLVNQTNLDDRESLMYFQRMLQTGGIIDMLREAGCDEGHTVKMFGIEFDFVN